MSGGSQLLLVIAGVHFLALGCAVLLMLPALRDTPLPPRDASDPGSDDGRGNFPRVPPPLPGRPRGGLPLPDAVPARIRLRDHRRLQDVLPKRQRRPAREPAREPVYH